MDVVVVSYDTPVLLRRCLDSLDRERSTGKRAGRVIVVDNSTRAESADIVRDGFPDVHLIVPDHNLGFGAGANRGIDDSDADYVLVLNADTELAEGALDRLADHLDRHPEVAMVGPRLVDPTGCTQASCAQFPAPWRLLFHETGFWKALAHTPFAMVVRPFYDPRTAAVVPWVLGAALAIRRESFVAVGGFDPGYFMYFEEVDLARRLAGAGATTRYEPSAVVAHVGGASTDQNRGLQRQFYASLARYHRIHNGDGALLRLRAAALFVSAVTAARELLRRPIPRFERRRRLQLWATIAGDACAGWPS